MVAAHGPAGSDRRHDGNLQLRPDGHRAGHDGDLRHHLPRSGTGRQSAPVCTLSVGNRLPVGFQGRALSRAKSRRNLDFQDVLDKLADMGIAIRVASPKLVMEEVRPALQHWELDRDAE